MTSTSTEATDFDDDPVELRRQHDVLVKKLARIGHPVENTGESTVIQIEEPVGASKALETALKADVLEPGIAAAPAADKSVPLFDPRPVTEIKDLEKFRLGLWVVKMFVLMMMFSMSAVMMLFIYTAYATQKLPDISLLATMFSHLKDVIMVILDSEK